MAIAYSYFESFRPALSGFGLNETEIKVYSTALFLGKQSASQLARHANLKRPYAYDILSSLVKRGLMQESVKNNIKHFVCTPPEQLAEVLEERASAHEEVEVQLDSPLKRAQQSETFFIPPGNHNHDRLLLELFEHPHPVKETILFSRPTIHSFPIELLQKIGSSENKIRRTKVVLEGYRSGRCEVVEILTRRTIWDMIRLNHIDGFKLYCKEISESDVALHLEYLIHLLKTYQNYNLLLTDAIFPFLLASFELRAPSILNYYTLFAGQLQLGQTFNMSSFLISDSKSHLDIQEKIVGWILNHPTTVRNRLSVISELIEVKEHLKSKGPLHASKKQSDSVCKIL